MLVLPLLLLAARLAIADERAQALSAIRADIKTIGEQANQVVVLRVKLLPPLHWVTQYIWEAKDADKIETSRDEFCHKYWPQIRFASGTLRAKLWNLGIERQYFQERMLEIEREFIGFENWCTPITFGRMNYAAARSLKAVVEKIQAIAATIDLLEAGKPIPKVEADASAEKRAPTPKSSEPANAIKPGFAPY